MRTRCAISCFVALLAVLLTWVLHGASSPLADFWSSHDSLPRLWLALNVFPFIAGAVISGNHGGSPAILFTALQFAQWFVVAFVVLTVVGTVVKRSKHRRR